MITLKLEYPHYDPSITDGNERLKKLCYSVSQVTGSVDYVPGQLLSRDTVRDLCEMTGKFKVIVVGRKD